MGFPDEGPIAFTKASQGHATKKPPQSLDPYNRLTISGGVKFKSVHATQNRFP